MKAPAALVAAAVAAAAVLILPRVPMHAHDVPALNDLPQAYDGAASGSGSQNDAGLKIIGVQCETADKARYSCEFGLSLPNAQAGRVYLDVALAAPQGSGWKLLSGLCRRFN